APSVDSGLATLATKRALPLTLAGLPPAGSHQLAWRTHSITSSARASSMGGTSRPSAFAVVRLMTRSNLVGCSTGMSPGFAPRRILSTYSAAPPEQAGKVWSIGHQTSGDNVLSDNVSCWQSRDEGQGVYLDAIADHKRVADDIEGVCTVLHRVEGGRNVFGFDPPQLCESLAKCRDQA